ncbi:hypothetical protein [Streptomyces sp. NPDC053069]|uniref:hypothetical protein n=1 Tax=Streptomyces sp. NPDC053069 TaxID=3365695 RepID=UPI0037D7D9C9
MSPETAPADAVEAAEQRSDHNVTGMAKALGTSPRPVTGVRQVHRTAVEPVDCKVQQA